MDWPEVAPAFGAVVLREFTADDVHLAVECGADPYIPLIGSLPAFPTRDEALAWVGRQRGRLAEGAGFSFAIADAVTDRAVGAIGLWLRNLDAGRASGGYSVSPGHRGRGIARDALLAVTAFAWSVPEIHRVELYVEPWNVGSARTAESAGYQREGVLRSYLEIAGTRRDVVLYAALRP